MERGMDEVWEGSVCGIEGCSPAAFDQVGPAPGAKVTLAPDVKASVTWRPFELNPGMPKAGLDRRAYRSAKFGSWQRSQALDAQVAAAGRSDGLAFNHDKMERTPNTNDAHRLIWLAGQQGKHDAVVEGLFAAYFNEGRDVGDQAVLADVGASAG